MPPDPTAPRPSSTAEGAFPNEWLLLATELGGVGTWALNLTTQHAEFSTIQRTLLGFDDDPSLDDVLQRIHADDIEDVAASLKRCAENGEPYDAEFRFAHPARGEIWIGSRAGRVRHPTSGDPYVVGINFDITRRRTVEVDVREMSREMAHRMKNVFALVSGISRIIARTAGSVPDFATALEDRMTALARLSDMTLDASRRGISLRQLVDAALSPFDTDRIGARVDDVRINNAAAQTLLLALNELATNAIKHGALRGSDGAVKLALTSLGADDVFRLEWVERGAEPVEPPDSTGFGTQVLTRVTRNTHGGRPSMEWHPDGLRFRCDWALSRMTA